MPERASITAFAIATGGATVGNSPIPFTPRGLVGAKGSPWWAGGHGEPWRALAGPILPCAEVRTALGMIGLGSLQVGGGILTEIGFEKILGFG
jgi:hypothetical protein